MPNKITIDDCKIINLPKINDPRGNLSFIESNNQIPFKIERSYWIYDVPGGEMRGGHAYTDMCEFIVALSGSFDLVLDDGVNSKTIQLNRSYYGVYVPKMIWRTLENFSTNSLCMILASKPYSEELYLRDYDKFAKKILK
jgi:dTDP-4-dehydrorhamnose 3,5-epimerase-like enzyme